MQQAVGKSLEAIAVGASGIALQKLQGCFVWVSGILAACQALILVEGKYVGDPLETTVFQASGTALRQVQG